MLERYMLSFGLQQRQVAAVAAQRVLSVALRQPQPEDALSPAQRALAIARSWVQDFAQRTYGPGPDWFFRIHELLGCFPRAFLETEPPVVESKRNLALELLPAQARCQMRPQEIHGAFEPWREALSAERLVSGAVQQAED